MLQLPDMRETRAYKDAVEEGLKKGLEEGVKKGVAIARLAAEKKSDAEIGAILGVDVELVRQVLGQPDRR